MSLLWRHFGDLGAPLVFLTLCTHTVPLHLRPRLSQRHGTLGEGVPDDWSPQETRRLCAHTLRVLASLLKKHKKTFLMSRAAARFKRSFQTSTPDRDARLRLAGESSLDRGAPGTNSSAPLSVHAPMFHQHHVLKTFAKDHIPDPAGILDVTSPKPASRPPKRDRLPVSSSDTKQVLLKHPHLPTPKSNQWIESPNTVTALSLHSTPVTKPPRQFHKPKSTSPVIHFGWGEFSIKQTPPTPITVPKEIPKTTPVTTLNGIPKSTPRFSLPPRRNRLTKSPVAKTDQVTQTTPMPPSIAHINTVPELAHQALQQRL